MKMDLAAGSKPQVIDLRDLSRVWDAADHRIKPPKPKAIVSLHVDRLGNLWIQAEVSHLPIFVNGVALPCRRFRKGPPSVPRRLGDGDVIEVEECGSASGYVVSECRF